MVQEDLSTRRCAPVAPSPLHTRTLSPACRGRYGPAKEQFTHVVFLNLAQSVVCMCWSGLWLLVQPALPGSSSGWLFWRVGLSNTVGPACGVLALKNIRHARSARPPLCRLSRCRLCQLHGSGPGKVVQAHSRHACPLRYGRQAILGAGVHGCCADCRHELPEDCAASTSSCLAAECLHSSRAGGISLFAATKNSGAVMEKLASPDALAGYTLVFLNLGMDAYTNAYQDTARVTGAVVLRARILCPTQVVERYPKTTPRQLMFYMNAWCTAYYALYFFAFTSECHSQRSPDCDARPHAILRAGAGFEAAAFCTAHAEAARQVLLYCICGVAGQACASCATLATAVVCAYDSFHGLRTLFFTRSRTMDPW